MASILVNARRQLRRLLRELDEVAPSLQPGEHIALRGRVIALQRQCEALATRNSDH